MRIVVAPDRFDGSLTAVQAAEAMAVGWLAHAPDDQVRRLPLCDAGAGLLDVLAATLPGTLRAVTVTGPHGVDVPAAILVVDAVDDPSGHMTSYVEAAQACGLHLAPSAGRTSATTSSRGVGELLLAALDTGASRIVVGVGGSASVDGGAGLLSALGVTTAGGALDQGLAGLTRSATGLALSHLDRARSLLAGVELVAATDSDLPLVGHHGAVLGAARQQGAPAEQLPAWEAAMLGYATGLLAAAEDAGVRDPGRLVALAGAGAGGGIGFALLALGAVRSPGAQVVLDAVGVPGALADADLVVTGEGTLDWRSMRGTAVAAVAHAAMQWAVPVIVVAGQVTVGRRELAAAGIESAYAVASTPQEVQRSMGDPAGRLAARVRRVARTWHPLGAPEAGNSATGRSIDD